MYRKYTDLYMELGRDGYNKYIKNNQEEMEHDIEMLAEVYNREGFTQGYLEGSSRGSKKDMLASVRPNHGGTCIGEVQISPGNASNLPFITAFLSVFIYISFILSSKAVRLADK